jgi:hypothetical protein
VAQTLQTYLTGTQRLLSDVQGNYWPVSELTDYINEARLRVVRDTGCNRQLSNIWLSAGIEQYPYGSVTGFNIVSGGSGHSSTPVVTVSGGGGTLATCTAVVTNGVITQVNLISSTNDFTGTPTVNVTDSTGVGANISATLLNPLIFDTINLNIYWGNTRYPCNWMTFTKFNAKLRYWVTYRERPVVFTVYAQNSFAVAPIPDQPYYCDVDAVVAPTPLVSTTDIETNIPVPFITPVNYYAAHLAKLREQSYGEAEMYKQMYGAQTKAAIASSFTRRIPNPYA